MKKKIILATVVMMVAMATVTTAVMSIKTKDAQAAESTQGTVYEVPVAGISLYLD